MDKNEQILEQIRSKCDSDLVDIVGGTMNLTELHDELKDMKKRSPEYILI